MNVLLHNVVSDITGVTGMRIIHAILEGERNPHVLAQMRDKRCKNSIETIEKSLEGNYRAEHIFSLKQAVEGFEFYQAQIAVCDAQIEAHLATFESVAKDDAVSTSEKKKPTKRRRSEPPFNLQSELHRVTGVDLTRINSISTTTAMIVISEIGLDMSRWKSEKQFSSWMGLSPGNKISGGKRLSGKTKPVVNRAANALRMAAQTLERTHCALGAYYRRMKARLGAPKALTAAAHKLACIIYQMLKNGTEYVEVGQEHYEQRYKSRAIHSLKKRAQQFGFELVESKM